MENFQSLFNVLLIEDNPADVELTEEAFERCDSSINLHAVSSGIEALDYLRDEKHVLPDLIMLDLNLPGWDGKSLLREIKQDSRLRKVPVIILSTSSADSDVLESYSLYANCYIVKPLDIDSFFEKVKTIEKFWLNTVLLPNTA